MRRFTFIALLVTFHLLFLQSVMAKIRLPAIVSSNMVLQRNTMIELWGWAEANELITVEASWLTEAKNIEADEEGKWRFELRTTNTKEPQTIHIKSEASEIILDNVLFGEVWLCSGQSNMEQPVKGYEGEPTFGAVEAIANSNHPDLRLFTVEKAGSKTPLRDVEKYRTWQEASPASVTDFSAIAYFFGQQLQEILDCPVGMIHTSWGGSSVEAWISKEVISAYQEVHLEDVDITAGTNHIPAALFNAMIYPIISYKIAGALWYQGESNRREPEQYKNLFPAMVKDWRTRWGLGDFPFYYVQIAPFIYDNDNEAFQTVLNSAFIRETQLQCLDLIPNSGMAVIMDIGDDYCIHPPEKRKVADRLLFNALNQTYGYHSLDYSSPIFDSLRIKEGGIVLKFKNAEMGLFSYGELEDFEIAGEDRVFYPASAKIGLRNDVIKRNEVFVKSDKVPDPVAVRYAWRNYSVGTLFGTNLLPASSFRTDQWDDATRSEIQFSQAQEKKEFTIDNCVSEFNLDDIVKTSVGYQYWFVDKDFIDGRTLKMSVVSPGGATHPPHAHEVDEFFFILEGTAEFYLDGETKVAGAYSSFYCPSNVPHGISNAGDSELKYLVIKKYED
ncbi:MAG: sialate O-acetylesterase [Bacteroidales bacterium]